MIRYLATIFGLHFPPGEDAHESIGRVRYNGSKGLGGIINRQALLHDVHTT